MAGGPGLTSASWHESSTLKHSIAPRRQKLVSFGGMHIAPSRHTPPWSGSDPRPIRPGVSFLIPGHLKRLAMDRRHRSHPRHDPGIRRLYCQDVPSLPHQRIRGVANPSGPRNGLHLTCHPLDFHLVHLARPQERPGARRPTRDPRGTRTEACRPTRLIRGCHRSQQ